MKSMSTHIQKRLEKASLNPVSFRNELNQSIKVLLASEIDELAAWFVSFTKDKPHLRNFKINNAYERNLLT